MKREEKVLYHIDRNGCGVEIGPGYNPIAPKRAGYKVHIIDHMNKEQLVAKYKEHNVPLENIEDVDYVWNGESYLGLTGRHKFYDWIIASHVIEHTPDLIGFLKDCDSILKDDGVVSLVIPDSRHCFDYFRPITGISRIIDAHVQKSTIHTPGTIAEYLLNAVTKAGKIVWGKDVRGEYALVHSVENVRNVVDYVVDKKVYFDAHAWCFTPHSFRLVVHDLNILGFIPFKEVAFFPGVGEFYTTLGREGEGVPLNRLEMLRRIKSEISL